MSTKPLRFRQRWSHAGEENKSRDALEAQIDLQALLHVRAGGSNSSCTVTSWVREATM